MARGSASSTAVGKVLRAFGEELAEAGSAQTGNAFTDIPEADALVKDDPNAFLLGVLFTQGISAERAWAGPYLLAERLGSLDLATLASSPERVAEALAARPALHRFVHTLPAWISSAARRVLAEYSGDASRMWPAGARVLDVVTRLRAFEGIGEKKAVMAVEILMRHFGVELEGAQFGGVAYDVHVRRVFLRTGLTDIDTPAAVRAAAVAVSPEAPGVLDLAAWLVGRRWCRPTSPLCDVCRLGEVCPRLTERHAEGVGVRVRR
jgi:uncharacterized HhH-GPD family protein